MLNHQGELIGVNVAIAENSNNVGFAIPSFHLLSLFDALATRPKHAKVQLLEQTIGVL
jgi:S1-C subfamily serine protease